MSLLTAITNNLPDGYSEVPTTWNPAFAAASAAKLAEDHATQRKTKTGDAAKMSEVGVAACIGPAATEAFIDDLNTADASVIGATNAATFHWIGRKLRDGKGDIEYTDAQTPTLLAGLVATGILTQTQADAITAFWTEPVPIWEAEGLSKAPKPLEILDAMGVSAPVQGGA
jgi:hypothetical protein